MPNTAPSLLVLDNLTVNEAGIGVGPLVGHLSATDPDVGDVLSYSLTSPSAWFVITNTNELHVLSSALLDYEALGPTHQLSVDVTVDDGAGGSTNQAFTITVGDLVADYAVNAVTGSALEGNSGTTDFTFTVTRSVDTVGASSVHWAVTGTGGSPANGTDFGGSFPSGNVSFADGETSKNITVHVSTDRTVESDEAFLVTLTNITTASATFSTATASSTILNDDWTASIGAATPLSQLESNDPSHSTFTYTVTRSGYLGAAADVSWSVSGLGANAADFVGNALPSGNVHFNAGDSTGTITVDVNGDSHVEADEGFRVTINTATPGGNIGTATSDATILNDDAGFSIDNPSITEGDSGIQYITFTVTRSGYLVNPDTVQWQFVNDAYVPVDTTDFPVSIYSRDLPNPPATKDGYPIFGTLDGVAGTQILRTNNPLTDTGAAYQINFASGETTHTLTFAVNGDTWLEANDKFHVVLVNPSPGSELITGQEDGTGTITNNDQVGTVGYKGTVMGTAGADSLTAPQQLNGYQFFGGPSNDTLLGYGYDNLVYGAAGDDSVYGGDGHSMVDGGAGNDYLRMHGYIDTVYGGTGQDTIIGTEGTALIDAGRGHDVVTAYGNTNLIYGNYGDDTIAGGDHDDTVYGNVGSDSISTTDQRNLIYGDDTEPQRIGFTYNDTIRGGDHDNTVYGQYGDDVISFIGQRNLAHGNEGNDSVTAGSGYDSVYGDDGNDTVSLSGWGNFVDGGDGVDTVIEPGARSVAAFKYVAGTWIMKFGYNAGSDQLVNVETVHFSGGGADLDTSAAAVASGMVMQGDQVGNDSLLGLGGNDTLIAFGYNNTIDGGSGNDSLDGGAGNASITGGDGADQIVVGGHTNRILAGNGDDRVTLLNLVSGSNHNNYIDLGEGNNTVSGGVDVNTIIGGSGHDEISVSGHNNLIQSGGGDDAISIGGGGQDTVDGGSGFDTVTFNFARKTSQIVSNADGSFDVHGPNGWDHLVNIERAIFTDGASNLNRGNSGDLNGDRLGDGVAQYSDGSVWVAQNHFPGAFTSSLIAAPPPNWQLLASGDLDGNGTADLIFQDNGAFGGLVWGWEMNSNYTVGLNGAIGAVASMNWHLRYAADFNGDARADLVLRDSSNGDLQIWLMNGLTPTVYSLGATGTFWDLAGAADFDGDGRGELLFRGADNTIYMWEMDGPTPLAMGSIGNVGPDWQVRGTGDFDGDGRSDILWRNNVSGDLYLWEMQGLNIKAQGTIATPGTGIDVVSVEDFTGDGRADYLTVDAGGNYTAVAMNGFATLGSLSLGAMGPGWHFI